MNKTVIIICILVSVFFVHAGISMDTQAEAVSRQKENMLIQNNQMETFLSAKQSMNKKVPVELSKAFGLVVNEIRYLEGYSGTLMDLSIAGSKENKDISNYFMASQYRGVKKLPVLIQVDKFSNETDMAAVLNDIYQLEVETDFKVTEIDKENNALIVKGDVYGL